MVGMISLAGSVLSTVPCETATTFAVGSTTTSGSAAEAPRARAGRNEGSDVLGVGEGLVSRELQPRGAVEEDPTRPEHRFVWEPVRADRRDAVSGEDLVVVRGAGPHAAGQHLAHDRMP